jgi:Ca-activated chloride channel homolog
MIFAQPLWFLLLCLPVFLAWRMLRGKEQRGLRLPVMAFAGRSRRIVLRKSLPWLNIGIVTMLIVGMTRPQRQWQEQKVDADAMDIVLALDISPSMLSRDFTPDRLTVAKEVLHDFVDNRPYDRLGLVAFAAEAFTQCPLTTDRPVLKRYLNELVVGRLENGTAIGMGLATALNRLKESKSKSRIVILVTDGENNAGYISPMQSAEMARDLGIRVYTVGIGTEGIVMAPIRPRADGSFEFAPREMQFDTKLLEGMAETAHGKFYRAFSPADLQAIYAEIDRLEKTEIQVSTIHRTTEIAPFLIAAAIVLLFLAQFLRWGILRAISE